MQDAGKLSQLGGFAQHIALTGALRRDSVFDGPAVRAATS